METPRLRFRGMFCAVEWSAVYDKFYRKTIRLEPARGCRGYAPLLRPVGVLLLLAPHVTVSCTPTRSESHHLTSPDVPFLQVDVHSTCTGTSSHVPLLLVQLPSARPCPHPPPPPQPSPPTRDQPNPINRSGDFINALSDFGDLANLASPLCTTCDGDDCRAVVEAAWVATSGLMFFTGPDIALHRLICAVTCRGDRTGVLENGGKS